jgi:hypothetical protein
MAFWTANLSGPIAETAIVSSEKTSGTAVAKYLTVTPTDIAAYVIRVAHGVPPELYQASYSS